MKSILTLIFCSFLLISQAQNVGIGTTTPTDQLHTTGSVRLQKYSGGSTRLVQIDSSGRLIATGAGAVFANNTIQAINDNGCATGVGITSNIIVSGQPNVAIQSFKIAVRVNITHPYDGDLRIYLFPPGTNVLTLANGNGGNGNNFTNTVFSDQAINSISTGTAPFTGQFKPLGGLAGCIIPNAVVSTFSAIGSGFIIPNGTWTLKVFDAANGDVGVLNDWSISFTGPESFTTADENNFIPKLAGGNFIASNIYQPAGSSNIGIGTTTPTAKLEVNGNTTLNGYTTINGGATVTGNSSIGGDLYISNGIVVGNTTNNQSGGIRLNAANDNKVEYNESGNWKSFTKEFYDSPSPSYSSAIRNQLIVHPTFEYNIPSNGYYLVTLEANTFPILNTTCATVNYIDNGGFVSFYSKTRSAEFFRAGNYKWHLTATQTGCIGGQFIPLHPSSSRIIYLQKNEKVTFAYEFDMTNVPTGPMNNWSADGRMTLLKVGD